MDCLSPASGFRTRAVQAGQDGSAARLPARPEERDAERFAQSAGPRFFTTMSRRWIQLLLLEAVGLLLLFNLLPKWNRPAPEWEPIAVWRTEDTPALMPRADSARVETLRARDTIPAPLPPTYHAPRFEGSAPLDDVQRTEYVRRRLSRSGVEFGALVNQALRSSLPPDGDASVASGSSRSNFSADNWPRR